MSTEPIITDENDPTQWGARLHAIEHEELPAAEKALAEARDRAADHYVRTAVHDPELVKAHLDAEFALRRVEDARVRALGRRTDAMVYQKQQEAQGLKQTGQARAATYQERSAGLQAAIEALVPHFNDTLRAGYELAALIRAARNLTSPEDRVDARVQPGGVYEVLGRGDELTDRVLLELRRHIGQFWTKYPDVAPGRMNVSLSEAHEGIANQALSELQAYTDLKG